MPYCETGSSRERRPSSSSCSTRMAAKVLVSEAEVERSGGRRRHPRLDIREAEARRPDDPRAAGDGDARPGHVQVAAQAIDASREVLEAGRGRGKGGQGRGAVAAAARDHHSGGEEGDAARARHVAYSLRPITGAIFLRSAISSANMSGVMDCGPSESARLGSLWTSIIRPSAPTAAAARLSGRDLVPPARAVGRVDQDRQVADLLHRGHDGEVQRVAGEIRERAHPALAEDDE